jgi:glyoxylase-like metal-dependent hydrolase (beta-lactamase superfamily II)
MGHAALPGTPVWLSQALATAIATGAPVAARYLEDAREFDSRWYVPRPEGHRWPAQTRGLAEGERVELGGSPMRVLHLPGHSPEGLGVAVEELGLLLVGDYLSPCEIPFVDDAPAYLATLERMLALLETDIAEVIPGHGPRLARAEALVIARADREYLVRLLDAGSRGDADAARALELPRAADVVGMRAYHLENCAKVGLIGLAGNPPDAG